MDSANIAPITTLHLDGVERWNVFRRLRELSIPCHCSYGHPLEVRVETVAAAIQVWSVVQQCFSPRSTLIDRLERCWCKKTSSCQDNPTI